MAACSSDEITPSDDGLAIAFSPTAEAQTRSSALTRDFICYATKTMADATVQTVMPAYTVREHDEWAYLDAEHGQYLKYWDLSAVQYDFKGVTPTDCMAFDAAGQMTSTRLLTVADDPMMAYTRRVNGKSYDRDLLPDGIENEFGDPHGAMTVAVPMRFHPMLAQVELQVFNASGTAIEVENFSVEASHPYTKGWLAETGWHDWEDQQDVLSVTSNFWGAGTLSLGADDSHSILVQSVIPQSIATYTLTARLKTTHKATPLVREFTLKDEWDSGYRYVYRFGLTEDAMELIRSEFEIMDWLLGDSKEFEETEW